MYWFGHPSGGRRRRCTALSRSGNPTGQPRPTASATSALSDLCAVRRAVRTHPSPSRHHLRPRTWFDRHRQPAAIVPTTPPPRPRRRLETPPRRRPHTDHHHTRRHHHQGATPNLRGLVLVALAEFQKARTCEGAGAAVNVELGAAVVDVEVAHRELTDSIERSERGIFDALHAQSLGRVREVGTRRVEDRVVVAAS